MLAISEQRLEPCFMRTPPKRHITAPQNILDPVMSPFIYGSHLTILVTTGTVKVVHVIIWSWVESKCGSALTSDAASIQVSQARHRTRPGLRAIVARVARSLVETASQAARTARRAASRRARSRIAQHARSGWVPNGNTAGAAARLCARGARGR